MAFISMCQAIFLQNTIFQDLCLTTLSSAEISFVLLGLSSHGLHESSLTSNECNYYEKGQNSKGSLGFNKKMSERELKWRQHSLADVRMISA